MFCECRDTELVLKDLDLSMSRDTYDCNICGRFFIVDVETEEDNTNLKVREVTIGDVFDI